MTNPLILASSSPIRETLLRKAGLDVRVHAARVDEDSIRQSLLAEAYSPRDIADALAEAKAIRVSHRHPGALTIGADQILDLIGETVTKAKDVEEAVELLKRLSGQKHRLHSAAVIVESGRPVWRHIGFAELSMRALSADFIHEYLDRNWESVRHSVGCYKIEEEGPRLFSRIDGSHFAILGLPLIEVLSYLTLRGELKT